MFSRKVLLLVGGAAIFALDASAVVAQDTTTRRPVSSQRISIRKDQGGEVQLRVDTVYSYRTDTLRLPGRTDTVVTTNTVVRVDTVRIPVPQIIQQIGGFYFGLGAGSSLPAANFNDSDHPGWRVEGMIGVDPIGSWFGARLSGGYNTYEPHSWISPFIDDAQMWNVALDAKVRAIAISPFSKRVQLYGIAGGSYNRFRNVLETDRDVFSIGDNVFVPNRTNVIDDSWHSGWGYNVGAGAEFGWGRTNLFVETRYSALRGQNTWITHVPIMVGLSWF
jgi:hypothetical protein